jgi:hypothetical protein
MKKIIILALAISASIGSFAQFNQGRVLVGGTLEATTSELSGSKTLDTDSKSLSITPQFGYFVIDHLAVGIGAEIYLSKTKYRGTLGNSYETYRSLQLQPFIRYYLNPGVFFQGQFGIGTLYTKYSSYDYSSNDTNTIISGGLAAGYALFLNDNIAIEPMVGYSLEHADNDRTSSGLFLKVGFQVYLGKK